MPLIAVAPPYKEFIPGQGLPDVPKEGVLVSDEQDAAIRAIAAASGNANLRLLGYVYEEAFDETLASKAYIEARFVAISADIGAGYASVSDMVDAAAVSAGDAATSEANAASHANAAGTFADEADTHRAAAALSESNAADSATAAESARGEAEDARDVAVGAAATATAPTDAQVDARIATQKGVPSGLADLDEDGLLPESRVPGWLTPSALSASYAPKWQPNTEYHTGDVVVAPDGSLVKAVSNFTSGTTYSSTQWTSVATTPGTQAKAELDTAVQALVDAGVPPAVSDALADDPTIIDAAVNVINQNAPRQITRTNLAKRPTGAGSGTGWAATASLYGTPTQDTSRVRRAGSTSLSLTRTTATPSTTLGQWTSAGQTTSGNTNGHAVTPGESVAVSCYEDCSVAARGRVRLRFWDAAGTTQIGSVVDSATVGITPGTWTRVSKVTTVPAGAVTMTVTPEVITTDALTNSTGGEQSWVQDLLIERSTTVGDYFDGDTADAGTSTYEWTGTAHASTSTEGTPTFLTPDKVVTFAAQTVADADKVQARANIDAASLLTDDVGLKRVPTANSAPMNSHAARLGDIKFRKGGVIGIGQKGAVAFQCAHQTDTFYANVLPLFKARGIPVSHGLVTGVIGNPAAAYEPTTATWDDVRAAFAYGVEVWAHSRTHLEPAPLGPGDTIKGETRGARQDIEAQSLYCMGAQYPGVPNALTPWYHDWFAPGNEGMIGWESEYGKELLSNFGLITMTAQGSRRFLGTGGAYGFGNYDIDVVGLTSSEGMVDEIASRPGMGVTLAFHPNNFGQPGKMSLTELGTFLDYVRAAWDAGTIEVLTNSAMALADTSTQRATLTVDRHFTNAYVRKWNIPTGATLMTDGGHGGDANYVRMTTATGQLWQGTSEIVAWRTPGQVVMFDGWVRNTSATASTAKVDVWKQSSIPIRPTWTQTVPADAAWHHVSFPVGIPMDATGFSLLLSRDSAGGNVDWSDCKLWMC